MIDVKRPTTILFVDDDVLAIKALQRALRRENYTIIATSSTHAARDLLATNPSIDIIISDERMREERGVSLLTYAQNSHPHVKRILLSGHLTSETTAAAIQKAAVFRCLEKPCLASTLVRVIGEALESPVASSTDKTAYAPQGLCLEEKS
jgi:DNA-binding NtrC family response regulator